ncbi:O-antigen ligase family protein [Nakamurella sp.]|uniref:O-antigen ligase family protein n=1 Tax=Nakamurella sp. TaxID=1869182 RepID=UPI003B3B6C5D
MVTYAARQASAHARRVRSFWTIALIGVVWAWICIPKILQTLLAPKYRYAVGVENAPYSRLAALADYGLYIGVIAVCGLIVIGYINDLNTSAITRLIVMVVPWVYIAVRDIYVPKSLSDEGVVYILVVVALWLLRPRIGDLQALGYLVGLTALISVAIALILPEKAIYRTAAGEVIATEKQIVPGGILVGIFTQGNSLGQFLALGLPTVFLVVRTWHRVVLVGLASLAIVWSASRGAMIAAGIGLLTYTIVRLSAPWLRRVLAPFLIFSAFAVVCIIPFVTTQPESFSNRGLVWIVSIQAWESNPLFGLGSNWYNAVGRTSARIAGSVFHAHNQLIQFLVTGGIIFAVLVAIQLIMATARATRLAARGEFFAISWLAVLAGSGLFEKSMVFVDNANALPTVLIPLGVLILGADLSSRNPDGGAEDWVTDPPPLLGRTTRSITQYGRI